MDMWHYLGSYQINSMQTMKHFMHETDIIFGPEIVSHSFALTTVTCVTA